MTMDELERESAELLPTRETLCAAKWHPSHSGGNYDNGNFTQVAGNSSGLINVPILSDDNINLNVLGIGF
ncbi:MAG: hypothetical protein ACRDP7_04585 [Trebonia sp.]